MVFNLFSKAKLDSPQPSQRLKALQHIAPEQEAQLIEMINHDESLEVREFAITKITTMAQILQVLAQQAIKKMDPKSAKALVEKSLQLVQANNHSLADLAEQDAQLASQVIHHLDDAQLKAIISHSDQQDMLGEMAIHAKSMPNRIAAIEKVTDYEILKHISKESSDKSVLQITRQKTKVLREKLRFIEEEQQKLSQVMESMRRLASKDYDNMYASRLRVFTNNWNDVDATVQQTEKASYQQLLDQCEALIEKNRLKVAHLQAIEECKQQSHNLCDQINNLITHYAQENSDASKVQIESLQQQWLALDHDLLDSVAKEKKALCDASLDKLFTIEQLFESVETADSNSENALDKVDHWIDEYQQIKAAVNWPYKITRPTLLTQIEEKATMMRLQQKTQVKRMRDYVKEIDERMPILKSLIRSRNLIKANRMFVQMQSRIDRLQGGFLESYKAKLELVYPDLEKLRELHQFVTNPKKEQLCEEMEKIISITMPVKDRALKIKQLQHHWQELTSSDAQADELFWDRFKIAADSAYEPVKEYHQKVDELKQHHLEQREALCHEIEAFIATYDWEHPDWNAIQAQNEDYFTRWKAYQPVFFAQNRPIAKRFHELADQMKQKLNVEKQENIELYKELLERAVALNEESNVEVAIESIKRLQARWKSIGLSFVGEERKLWHAFKKAGDTVFAKKRDEVAQKRQHTQDQIDQVKSLIKEITVLGKLQDDELMTSHSKFEEINQQLRPLIDELPEKLNERLSKDLSGANHHYENQHAGIPERRQAQSLKKLEQCAQLVMSMELAAWKKDLNEVEACNQKMSMFMDELDDSLADDQSIADMVERVDIAKQVAADQMSLDDSVLQQREKDIRQLLIELEIAFDHTTPDEDKAARMSFQLTLLQDKKQSAAFAAQSKKSALDWQRRYYAIAMIDADVRQKLDARYQSIINKL